MLSILEFEDKTKKANEILKEYEEFGYIDLMKDESEYLYNYIKDLQNKVIEQQTRLHDIDKRSCDRLQIINEAVESIRSFYEEEYHKSREELKTFNLENCTYEHSLVVLGILLKSGVE